MLIMVKAKLNFNYLIIFGLITLSNLIYSQPTIVETIQEERTYKIVGPTELKVNIYKPAKLSNEEKLPAIIFFHGGAWAGGHSWQFKPQCGYLAEYGIVAMTFEYRVRKRHGVTPFECLADAKSAIRWVRKNAIELGVDENRIAAGGGSAGGHLAACTALIKDFDEEENLEISSVPNALVLFNAVFDVPQIIPQHPRKVRKIMEGREKEISPIHHVEKGLPPTIIFHGTLDGSVPFHQATKFCEEMNKYGNRCNVVPFEGRKHGFFNYNKGENPDFLATMEETIKFLTSIGYLKSNSTINR